jgi:hypothetical protein
MTTNIYRWDESDGTDWLTTNQASNHVHFHANATVRPAAQQICAVCMGTQDQPKPIPVAVGVEPENPDHLRYKSVLCPDPFHQEDQEEE